MDLVAKKRITENNKTDLVSKIRLKDKLNIAANHTPSSEIQK